MRFLLATYFLSICLASSGNKISKTLISVSPQVTLASQDCKACQAPQVHQGWAHRDCQGLLDSQDPRDHQVREKCSHADAWKWIFWHKHMLVFINCLCFVGGAQEAWQQTSSIWSKTQGKGRENLCHFVQFPRVIVGNMYRIEAAHRK